MRGARLVPGRVLLRPGAALPGELRACAVSGLTRWPACGSCTLQPQRTHCRQQAAIPRAVLQAAGPRRAGTLFSAEIFCSAVRIWRRASAEAEAGKKSTAAISERSTPRQMPAGAGAGSPRGSSAACTGVPRAASSADAHDAARPAASETSCKGRDLGRHISMQPGGCHSSCSRWARRQSGDAVLARARSPRAQGAAHLQCA